MTSKKVLTAIIYDIYRELYANATPKADFDELVANAIIDSEGRKVIPYDDYEIDRDLMDEIILKHCKSHKLKKNEINQIKVNIYLGCSPRTKIIPLVNNNNTNDNERNDN